MALLHVNFFSEAMRMNMEMDVILPQKANTMIGMESNASEGKIKTVYLLHGLTDDHTTWQRRTSIERYASKYGIAVIMPTGHRTFYTDTAYGMKYWTYASRELPAICHELFPQLSDRKEDNLVAGLSMGGYGAWKMALGTSLFGAGASLSGSLDMLQIYESGCSDHLISKEEYDGIFGSPDKLRGSDDDLCALLKKRMESGEKPPRLYGWCGTSDFLYQVNKKVWKIAEELGYDLTLEESEGNHQWKYWDNKIQDVLSWWLNGEKNS